MDKMGVGMSGKLDYSVRESHRAKRVILRVAPTKGLEVVIPRGFNRRRLPEILKTHGAWIEKQLLKLQQAPALAPPDEINLAAIQNRWRVQYQHNEAPRFLVREHRPDLLSVEGDTADTDGLASALRRWLHLKAQAHLIPWAREVSREMGIPFKKATVRGQTTRWASCSQAHNLSLNRSLLFLPQHLVRHVLLHELCHTQRFDHSPGFWRLLEDIEPEYKRLEAELKKANRRVPWWVNGNHR